MGSRRYATGFHVSPELFTDILIQSVIIFPELFTDTLIQSVIIFHELFTDIRIPPFVTSLYPA